jgi:hypothetical protein
MLSIYGELESDRDSDRGQNTNIICGYSQPNNRDTSTKTWYFEVA